MQVNYAIGVCMDPAGMRELGDRWLALFAHEDRIWGVPVIAHARAGLPAGGYLEGEHDHNSEENRSGSSTDHQGQPPQLHSIQLAVQPYWTVRVPVIIVWL